MFLLLAEEKRCGKRGGGWVLRAYFTAVTTTLSYSDNLRFSLKSLSISTKNIPSLSFPIK